MTAPRIGPIGRLGLAIGICIVIGGRGRTAASSPEQNPEPTPLQSQVFEEMDANRDSGVDRGELTAYVSQHIAALLRATGASVDETSIAYQEFIAAQTDSLLNASSADGNDTISAFEMVRLVSAPLLEPLAGTFSQLMPTPAPPTSGDKPWFKDLADWLIKRVQIRQSFLDDASIGKPAKISFATQAINDETVKEGDPRRVSTIQSAVSWRTAKEWKWGRWYSRPVAGYEVNVISNKPENDQITHRVGGHTAYLRRNANSPFSSSVFLATLDYKTDRGYDAEVWGCTFQYTFYYRQIGVGQYLPRRKPVGIRWQPYFGVVFGDVNKVGEVKVYQEMSDFTHWFAKIAGEIKLGPRWLVTPEIVSWKGKRVETNVNGEPKEHNWQGHYSLTSRWILSESKGAERASIQVTANVGRNSPAFKFEKVVEIALGFKF